MELGERPGESKMTPSVLALVMTWVRLGTLLTARRRIVEKEQVLRGRNPEFYFWNVKLEILARHPSRERCL